MLLATGVGLVALAVLLVAPRSPDDLRALVAAAGPFAPLALLACWVVLVPALFSGALLAGASGLVLGPAAGVGVALVGATAGACVSFLVARRSRGDATARLARGRVGGIERRLAGRPVLGIAALRAAPGMPAGPLAYAAGLTRVRLRHFACGMALGGAPRILAYVLLGGSLTSLGSPVSLVAIGLLAAMTLGGLTVAWRARRTPASPA